jgi:hypothetical protein
MKLISAALIIVILLSVIIFAYTTFTQPTTNNGETSNDNQNNDTPHSREEPTILTLFTTDTIIEYTQTEIMEIPSITGRGGFRTSFPSIIGVGNYTGIAMNELLEPLTYNISRYSISVIASDGYISNYTYEEINGNVSIYDATNASNEEPLTSGGVEMILAYEYEGQPLDALQDGRFKIAYISESGSITASKYWAKFVVEIQIIPEENKQ